jgi:hypothetical protein
MDTQRTADDHSSEAVRLAIRELDANARRNIQARDPDAMVDSYYAEDARVLPPGQGEVEGKGAIREMWRAPWRLAAWWTSCWKPATSKARGIWLSGPEARRQVGRLRWRAEGGLQYLRCVCRWRQAEATYVNGLGRISWNLFFADCPV